LKDNYDLIQIEYKNQLKTISNKKNDNHDSDDSKLKLLKEKELKIQELINFVNVNIVKKQKELED